ncbi:PliI family lysozyme inhibitor of I-type lysozyme [Mucilaginibacter auburnensis]|uniref:PliI/PliC-like inhibitor of I-type lysozyme n=1 Tax=Mucilaginibacter auburnensis TaxID=1457233 RepID=A0A2H9VLU9_9SPHI|nr:PliI family lysozyme inhibitor of I-type lysozyme [Mucilaginibacter auburnensis]PJJ79293.1 PliI/PliC-like inhibitor of I-type lysozyme [Mucilaginibacter auburnensis]
MKRYLLFVPLLCAIIAGCGNNEKPVVKSAPVTQSKTMEPFRFHKLVEVSPGQYYDVVSWGRASVDTGAFLILHSDSLGRKYTTTTGDLDGAIVDVFNTDMDADGNPEIIIQAKSSDTTKYVNIYAFEFNNNHANEIRFPSLKSSKSNYRGQDNFYIQEGKLIREFPSYTGEGKDAKPTGGKYKFEYTLSGNDFDIKTLVKDSTLKDTPVAKEPAPVKKKETVKKKATQKKRRRR